ncbi:MAG: response regulator [Spirochaetaceae bacterium]|jgi:putative two-component system response regulator|nr:response regulator [Spirochaetaceae bacterium]
MSDKNSSSELKKNTILLVDDEPANLSVLSKIIQNDYRVLAVTSGKQALNLLKKDKAIDLIVLDIMMPEMNGYETIKQIRKDPELVNIPVIFITTLGSDVDEVFGFKIGAVDYIHKPVKPAIVHLRIQTHLELKKNRDILKNQNIWLEEEITRQVDEKTLLLEVSLTTIVGLAETRDTETGYHIVRTKEYVKIIAENFQKRVVNCEINNREVQIIAKAAQLHDIGKIGIPDAILLKPGSLTKEEFDIMKNHSRIGGNAIEKAMDRTVNSTKSTMEYSKSESFQLLEFARIIALSHHEKWDGSGYPEGLAGNKIPLSARIMAIADVFDALTSKRVYKESIPIERAIEIITQGKGTHFDPFLIEILLDSLDEFRQIFYEYGEGAG